MTSPARACRARLEEARRRQAAGEEVAWDLVVAPVEALVWRLPAADRPRALADVARARALLPAPPWRGAEAIAAAERVRARVRGEGDDAGALAAIGRVPAADARWTLHLEVWPALGEPARAEALARALDDAFAIDDPIHAGQAVAAVVLRDPDAWRAAAVARAEGAEDPDLGWALGEELIRKLPDDRPAVSDDAARAEARAEVLEIIKLLVDCAERHTRAPTGEPARVG